MTFIVPPGRNRIVQAAFAGLRKEQRAEKKAKPAPDVDLSDQQRRPKNPTPAAKKTVSKKKARAK